MTQTALVAFLLPALTAMALTALVTPIMSRVAVAAGVVARPKDDRWHKGHVPMLGGIAILVGTMLSTLWWAQSWSTLAVPAIAAGAVMFVVGLSDDLIGMKPNTKLTGQIAVACLVVLIAPSPHWVELPAVGTLLTILWVVGITNALNLLDNMDGLCAGIAAIAATALCASSGAAGVPAFTYAAALAGAAAGFLFYNFQPASVFMGDSGSLFLGASLAVLSLGGGLQNAHTGMLSAMAVPVLLMAIPIFDTTFVTISRKLSFRAASTGGKDHTSHRLVALGFSERHAVLMCYALAIACGTAAVLLGRTIAPETNLVVALLVIALLLLAVQLGRVKVYGGADYAWLTRNRYTPLIVDVMYKRRIFEVFLDLCLVTLAYYAAYIIRFDTAFPLYYQQFEQSLPVVIACELVVFFVVGLYRGVWRYMGVADLTTYGKAVVGGTLASVIAIVYLYRFEGYSRGVFIINAMALTILLIGSRTSFRFIGELAARHSASGRGALVYGAGDGGALLIRELRNNPKLDYRVVGLIDDDPAKQRKRILGVPVMGTGEALGELVAAYQPEAVIVSTAKLAPERLARLQATCFDSGTRLLQLDFQLKSLAADRSMIH